MLSPHAIAVLLLTAVALYLFSRERLPIETSSTLIIMALALGFLIFPFDYNGERLDPMSFFSGFSNEALIAICALMMASRGLVRTGALAPLSRLVSRAWSFSPALAFGLVLAIAMMLSAFMNNTPLVVLLIPLLASVAAKSRTPVSSMLMPMTFSAQIGGMGTPIGTSLNLLVIGTAASLGVPRFHMFDFIVPAATAGGVGLLYLWLIAPRLLPSRDAKLPPQPSRVFTAQLTLTAASAPPGATVQTLRARTNSEMGVRHIVRPPGQLIAPLPDTSVREGDRLLVQDTAEQLKEYAHVLQARLYSGDTPVDADHPLVADGTDQKTTELVVTPRSLLDGRTLHEIDFDDRFQVLPLAIHRPDAESDQPRPADLRDTRLSVGDILLVQGTEERIESLKRNNDVLALDAQVDVPHTAKARVALLIMGLIVLVASLRIAPVALAALAGVVAMIFSGCLKWREATRALDSSMIMLMVAAIALSTALIATGGAAALAGGVVAISGALPPAMVLSAVMLTCAVLSNLVSNSASAVICTPIAVELARQMGLPPEPFVLAVLFGVNMSYATPLADNCNILVYSAGGYRFADFLRVGVPLTLIMWVTLTWALLKHYPLASG